MSNEEKKIARQYKHAQFKDFHSHNSGLTKAAALAQFKLLWDQLHAKDND